MSKWIWVIFIVILVIGGFLIFGGGDSSGEGGGAVEGRSGERIRNIDDAPDSEFSGLGDSNEVFDEIDSALEFIE